jgi:hypothetical protein
MAGCDHGRYAHLLLDRRMQIDHPTAIACSARRFSSRITAPPPVARYHAIAAAQLGNHCLLTIAKARLAFFIEDPRDIGTRAQFNFLIGVFEWQAQLFGQQTADGAFSSPHRPYKNQISHRINDSQQSPGYS